MEIKSMPGFDRTKEPSYFKGRISIAYTAEAH
jgi:hypothetical protein